MMICLLGRPGSGKTTLARSLATHCDLPHISSGDIARSMSASDPATRIALEQGDYAPEAAMRLAVRTAIERASIERGGFVLDGFPRKLAQLVCLWQWCQVPPLFVYLDTEATDCIQRLVQRNREDDLADMIATRLDAFDKYVMPMVQALNTSGDLLTLVEQSNDTRLRRILQFYKAAA